MNGLMVGRLGIPGSGKSHFVRSAAAVGKTWVALTDPSEGDGYDGSGVETALFWDADWLPFADKWQADGFGRLLKALYALRERTDIAVVGLDSMTGVSELISHDVRKMSRAATLKDVGEYGLGFQRYAAHIKQLLHVLQALTLAGKHVVTTWHVSMKEQEGAGLAKIEKGEPQFEDRLLPQLEGSIRQHVSGYFSVWAYSVVTGSGVGVKYMVSLLPDVGVPAKTRLTPVKIATANRVANEFRAVLEAVGR